MLRERRLHHDRAAGRLRALARLDVNYRLPAGSAPYWNAGWNQDRLWCTLAREIPGDPVSGGAWDIACRLVHDYQFAEPRIVRALYLRDDVLLGRNMLLEGRFCGLRFDMGVRVTSVIDEARGTGETARRVWGWGYETLQGHLEQGEMTYEVVKHLHTGEVEFVVTGHSRRAPLANPVIALGFILFGRMTQHRFYRASGRRLRRLVQAELQGSAPLSVRTVPGNTAIALAPSHAPDGR
ncbi:DUF1990 family protein [Streptomyces sp. NPDC051322]|uniref:DUF1990 family protein n=1 Tax=Streptomyces sp. NPDC051322 TaxID=3154645 RepID=UPI00344F5466